MEKLKIGVMGLKRGNFVMKCGKALSDEMIVSAVCETDRRPIEDLRPYFTPETKVYEDFDEFINSGIDAVVLCNYFHEHAKYAIKALDAGVAVLSETTAAPSLGECVDLVEAVERNNGKYMLGTNSLFFSAVHAMKDRIQSGEYGRVMYADAEYIHTISNYIHPYNTNYQGPIDYDNLHWRQLIPTCYYNMHTLGPLMYITNSMPIKVLGKAVHMPSNEISSIKINDTPKTFSLTEMDDGAIFNTTGSVRLGPTSKWYRIACKNGTLETVRYNHKREWLLEARSSSDISKTFYTWDNSGAMTTEEKEKYSSIKIEDVGHGGVDFILMINFLKYLREGKEIFYDVYRSVALSAAAILTWYSILDNSKQFDIPDFKDKEARKVFKNDYRMPFGNSYKDLTLKCKLDDDK
jgi:predicted dehydrogenase